MKKPLWICAALVVIGLIALGLVLPRDPTAYHFSEFESIKTNFNDYRPSLFERLGGIQDNQSKWDYHLHKLVEIGAVQHKRLVFTEVPYTREASKRIWRSVNSNFPNAVMFIGTYYDTNDAGYGRDPYVLQIWDVPSAMERWSAFFETNNQRQ